MESQNNKHQRHDSMSNATVGQGVKSTSLTYNRINERSASNLPIVVTVARTLGLGTYQPDRMRRLSHLPAFMEVLREAERKLAKRTPWSACAQVMYNACCSLRDYVQRKYFHFSQRLNLSTLTTPSHDDIVEQAKLLCKEYITCKLKRLGINNKKLPVIVSTSTDVSEELQYLGSELERMYPELYKNICRQLNVTFSSEEVVRRVYTLFAEELCKNDIHWGKVVALYVMAGAFGVECVQQGHPEYVNKLVETFGNVVSKNLVIWVSKQGGWIIPDIIRNFKGTKDHTWLWALSALGALIGFVITLMLTITL